MTNLTSVGWTVDGVYLAPSDSLYQKLEEAINSDQLSAGHLRKISGQLGPIKIYEARRHIQFNAF